VRPLATKIVLHAAWRTLHEFSSAGGVKIVKMDSAVTIFVSASDEGQELNA